MPRCSAGSQFPGLSKYALKASKEVGRRVFTCPRGERSIVLLRLDFAKLVDGDTACCTSIPVRSRAMHCIAHVEGSAPHGLPSGLQHTGDPELLSVSD